MIITSIARSKQIKRRLNALKFRHLCFRMCVLGRRLLKDIDVVNDCNKHFNGVLHNIYCGNSTHFKCDPYFLENNITIVTGIRGLASGVFLGKITIFVIIT